MVICDVITSYSIHYTKLYDGASDQVLARASIALTARLKADKLFATINNGDLSGMRKERES